MSFGDTRSNANRSGILVAVAAIHAVAIFAVVTGLGGVVVRIITDPPFRDHEFRPEVQVPLHETKKKPRPTTVTPRDPTQQRQLVNIDDVPKLGPIEPPELVDLFPTGAGETSPQPTPTFEPRPAAPIGSPSRWASEADYPPADLHAGHEGATRFRLAITPDGGVAGCTVTTSSGWPGLDAATCRLVTARTHFRPSTDNRGARVPGNFVGAIRWVIPN